MNHLKTLGAAMFAAMALMAFVGANTASADVLCTENNTPQCGKITTALTFSLQSGSKAVFSSTAGETLMTCTESSMSGAIEKQGEGIEPEGSFTKENLTWGGCSSTLDAIRGGRLKVETIETSPGVFQHTVTASEAEFTYDIFGVSCTYGPGLNGKVISLGDLAQGSPALLNISTVINKTAGGFLCPADQRWTATYQVTNHTGLWVSKK